MDGLLLCDYRQRRQRVTGFCVAAASHPTIRAAVTGRQIDFVVALNLTTDLADTVGPTLEWRYGDLPTWAAVVNAAVQSLGLASWSILLWRRSKPELDWRRISASLP